MLSIENGKVVLYHKNQRKVIALLNSPYLIINKKKFHLFHKYHAIGFNKELIDNYNIPFDTLMVSYEDYDWTISRKDIPKHGIVDKMKGFEMQYFVPIEVLEKLNLKQYEEMI